MKPTVYIETTIPSYCCDQRSEIARDIARTQEWWDQERHRYECFTSETVLEELQTGNHPYKNECLKMMERIPLIAVTSEVAELATVYQVRGLMPKNPAADSVHLALATFIESIAYSPGIADTWPTQTRFAIWKAWTRKWVGVCPS